MQSWFSRAYPQRSPYRLYALSNLGSLLGLFAYPFLVERTLTLKYQTWAWSGVYLLFICFCAVVGLWLWRQSISAVCVPGDSAGTVKSNTSASSVATRRLRSLDVFLWLALSACGSVILLSVTNQLCQNVAAIPFLWVLPLGLYLITFILCFERDGWYRRTLFTLALFIAIGLNIWSSLSASFSLSQHIALYGFILFVGCMICHGELAHLKPEPSRLTFYFFLISVGGALGGLFVSLIAPLIFTEFYEFNLGLFGSAIIILMMLRRERWSTLEGQALRKSLIKTGAFGLIASVILAAAVLVSEKAGLTGDVGVLVKGRNFYGIVRVEQQAGSKPGVSINTFTHGNTTHGFQYNHPIELRGKPTGYYMRGSGVGMAIDLHPRRTRGEPLHVGLIGLGVGTLAAYGTADDRMEFYEIDPNVEIFARKYFTFLSDAATRGAAVNVRLGDARIVLERQLQHPGPMQFDVLVMDAFSSDAIPVHLLTEEAFALYKKHLKSDGIIAVHLTNRYLDLTPVVQSGADSIAMKSVQIWHQSPVDEPVPPSLQLHSEWILITNNEEFLTNPLIKAKINSLDKSSGKVIRWTDQFSNLFEVLRK